MYLLSFLGIPSKGKLQKLHLNIHPLDISIGNTSFGNIISSSFENIGLELRKSNSFPKLSYSYNFSTFFPSLRSFNKLIIAVSPNPII